MKLLQVISEEVQSVLYFNSRRKRFVKVDVLLIDLYESPTSSPSLFFFGLGLLPADVHRSHAAGQTGVFHAAAAHCVLSVRGRGEGVRDLAVHEEDELAGNETHAGGSHGGGSGRKHRVRLGSRDQFIIKN